MKAEVSLTWLIVAAIVVAVAGGYYFTNGFTKFSGQVVNGCQSPTDSSNNLLIPLMGYYECAPAQGGQITDTIQIDSSKQNYYNLCTINTPSCSLTMSNGFTYCDKNDVTTGFFGGAVCSSYGPFLSSTTINSNARYSSIFVPTLSINLVPQVGTVQRTYTPFTLWQTSPTGGRTQVYQTANAQCSPPNSNNLCTGDTTGQYCTKNVYHGSLGFYETSNYFDHLVIGPVQGNTYTYNGQTVYGAGSGTLYSIGKVTLNDGSCYSVPGSIVANVACLPGAISGGQQCGTDFQWHLINNAVGSPSVVPACLGDFQCPGQGNYIPDFSDSQRKTAVKYSCQSGQCVLTTKVVSTCSDSNACPTGTTCFLNPSTGQGSCLAPAGNPLPGRVTGIQCSDGVTVVDDIKKCPSPAGIPWSIIFAIIGAILTFLVAGGRAIKERDEVGIALAAAIAVVAAIVIWWFVENFVAIAIFGGIIAILGGLALFFFGGAIIAAFLVIGAVIGEVREWFA